MMDIMNAGTDWNGLVWIKPLLQHSASLGFVLLIFVSMAEAAADVVACDAQKPCDFGRYCILGQCKPNLFLNSAVIVMGITFLMVAIVFAIGRVLEHPRLIHWAETELWEAVGTAFILALYLGASGILDEMIGPAFYQTSIAYPGKPGLRSGQAEVVPWTTVEAHVRQYLNKNMNTLKDVIEGMSYFAIASGLVSTLSIYITTSATQFYTALFPSLGSIQQLLSIAAYAVTASALQLEVQIALVNLWGRIFTILLPLGILFRAFPLTRSAGSALIAIAVGFTIILPISYLLIEDIGNNYWNTYCSGKDLKLSAIIPSTGDLINVMVSGLEDFMKDHIKKLFDPKGVGGCMIFKVAIESFLLPVFAYLITLNITRHLATILGAHIDLSTLVRII